MNSYLLFKSLHLIAVISWMAGLLYLPRIFVYHSEADHESQKTIFKIMERKLYNYIMIPAMLLSWLFGMLLIYNLGFGVFSELWMQVKTALIVILTFYHFPGNESYILLSILEKILYHLHHIWIFFYFFLY